MEIKCVCNITENEYIFQYIPINDEDGQLFKEFVYQLFEDAKLPVKKLLEREQQWIKWMLNAYPLCVDTLLDILFWIQGFHFLYEIISCLFKSNNKEQILELLNEKVENNLNHLKILDLKTLSDKKEFIVNFLHFYYLPLIINNRCDIENVQTIIKNDIGNNFDELTFKYALGLREQTIHDFREYNSDLRDKPSLLEQVLGNRIKYIIKKLKK